MTEPQRSDSEVRDELRDIDEEIAVLRAQALQLRSSVSGAGPMDLPENAATLTFAEEQEALVEVLEDRRARLLRRLGEAEG